MYRALVAFAIAVMLAIAPVGTSPTDIGITEAAAAAASTKSCYAEPPRTIRVFRIHRRGSSIPARVDTVGFRTYVMRVMASGAWPAYKPMESLKAGAAAIYMRALYFVCHPQKGYRWRGKRYDIHDGSPRKALRRHGADAGQLYRGPWVIHSKIRRAVDAIWGIRLVKRDGRMAKPQWSGDGGRCGSGKTGNRLPEDAVTRCAKAGWSWQRIVAYYLNVRMRWVT